MDKILQLLDFYLEDGKLSHGDYKEILSLAKENGISEQELNQIIAQKAQNYSSAQISPDFRSSLHLPYLFAIMAFLSTFTNWIGIYSLKASNIYNESLIQFFTPWNGNYGIFIILSLLLGCFLFHRKKQFYWLAGIIAMSFACLFYFSILNIESTIQLNKALAIFSNDSGIEILWGFWLFTFFCLLFVLSGLINISDLTIDATGVLNKNKAKLQSSWRALLFSIIPGIFLPGLIDGTKSFIVGAIVSVLSIFILFLFYLISKSFNLSGFILLVILFLCSTIFNLTIIEIENWIFIALLTYPISFIQINWVLTSTRDMKKIESNQQMLF